jgi:hypothetical protein
MTNTTTSQALVGSSVTTPQGQGKVQRIIKIQGEGGVCPCGRRFSVQLESGTNWFSCWEIEL